jgi:aminoglycoside phosphotransferase (APT) family kinase protein
VPDECGRGPDPRDGWIAAVLPSGARRLLVHDERLSAALAPTAAGGVPDAEIGPAIALTGTAAFAAVPVHVPESPSAYRAVRAARRIAGAAAVRTRTAVARRRLRRLGYPDPAVLVWERGEPLRDPRLAVLGPAAHRLPLNAVVSARREPSATMLEAAAAAAGHRTHPGRAKIGSSGVLVAETDAGHLRVAVGPARRALSAQAAALAKLQLADPPPIVADRVPWTIAVGETGLAAWSLERTLSGGRAGLELGRRVAADCLDLLVALHGVGHAAERRTCAQDAEIVAAMCDAGLAKEIRALARELDEALADLPRGFGHGDFWSGNLLVEGGRLTGVIDWAAAGPGQLPLLDLMHLHVSARRDQGRPLGAAIAAYSRKRTQAEQQAIDEYAGRTGLTRADGERLVAAYWLSATARELTDPDRARDAKATARFLRDNVQRPAGELLPRRLAPARRNPER